MEKNELIKYFKENLNTIEEENIDEKGYIYFTIDKNEILKASNLIKEKFKASNILMEHCFGTDFPEEKEIHLIYTWWQIDDNLLFNFKIKLPYSDLTIPSLTNEWAAINWHEREAWEMLGVEFEGHPNLKQFLLPDELFGEHPMRKSFELRVDGE